METYVILRRSGWRTPDELRGGRRPLHRGRRAVRPTTSAGSAATCSRSRAASFGTVCIYQASSPEAIRAHAYRAGLPVDEIVAVADTVIVRPDPVAGHCLREEREQDEEARTDSLALAVLPVLGSGGNCRRRRRVRRRRSPRPPRFHDIEQAKAAGYVAKVVDPRRDRVHGRARRLEGHGSPHAQPGAALRRRTIDAVRAGAARLRTPQQRHA